jgi:hypothetical protein
MSRTTPPAALSDAEISRLKRIGQRRGRRNPAKVPARLARTSAFAPKRRGLITDANYDRLYVVPGHSIVRVAGRELGSQHRDDLYAVFRLDHKTVVLPDPNSPVGHSRYLRVETTWRELLRSMGLTPHANNVTALHYTFEDIKKVVVTVYEGQDHNKLLEQHKQGKLPRAPGRMGNMLHDVEWEGLQLDSRVTLHYGEWSANMVFSAKLVSLNADVHFALASDYAKSFCPTSTACAITPGSTRNALPSSPAAIFGAPTKAPPPVATSAANHARPSTTWCAPAASKPGAWR